jgi:hypothetical protein
MFGRECYFREARQLARELGPELRLPQERPYPRDILVTSGASGPAGNRTLPNQGLATTCCVVAARDRINFGNVLELGIERVWRGRVTRTSGGNWRRQSPPTCAARGGSRHTKSTSAVVRTARLIYKSRT